MSSASVREMVRRGAAKQDGRPGSEAAVAPPGASSSLFRRPAALAPGVPVLVRAKDGAEVRGVVEFDSQVELYVRVAGRLRGLHVSRFRVLRLDRVRRDGITRGEGE